jgi:hypothetical protein
MDATNIKTQRISETSQIGASGRAEPTITIIFTVDGHGPFTETFPKAGFDPNAANIRIKEFASKLKLLGGTQ